MLSGERPPLWFRVFRHPVWGWVTGGFLLVGTYYAVTDPTPVNVRFAVYMLFAFGVRYVPFLVEKRWPTKPMVPKPPHLPRWHVPTEKLPDYRG